MGRIIRISVCVAAFLAACVMSAQDRSVSLPEDVYRPIFGYVIDTCTNKPMTQVQVFGFESMEDAMRGRKAIEERRNPLRISLKGDIVVADVDASGRYMIPAVSKGVLLFHFRDSGRILFEEVKGRTEVSLGRKVEDKGFRIDLSAYSASDMRPRRERGRTPAGVRVDMDFNARFPALGKDASGSRVYVERRIYDIEDERILDVVVPVVRDGKTYHRKAGKIAMERGIVDTLSPLADRFASLNDTTHIIRVKDRVDAEPWKDRCFRLEYVVMLDDGVETKAIDTLHMMTNRVGRPVKFLEYAFRPYAADPGEDDVSRFPIRRRLVAKGEFRGYVPEILLDTVYALTGIHVKASAAPMKTYSENMAVADSCMQSAMDVIRDGFASKICPDVRIIRTSEVVRWTEVADVLSESGAEDTADDIRKIVKRHYDDVDAQTAAVSAHDDYGDVILPCLGTLGKVVYRYDFLTSRQFSRKEYMDRFAEADAEDIPRLCRRAMEESELLEGEKWQYAANLLASHLIGSGTPDCTILDPYAQAVLNDEGSSVQQELIANQVIMLMLAERFDEAEELASYLSDEYVHLRATASCKAGNLPSSDEERMAVASSSPRNSVIMDMCADEVDEDTFGILAGLPEDDATAWYLKARCLCIMYGNDMADMTSVSFADSPDTVYDDVKKYLRECFRLDPGLADAAVLDGDINEYALKEVLGVFVL